MALDANDPFVKKAREQGISDAEIQAYMDKDQEQQQHEQAAAAQLPVNQAQSNQSAEDYDSGGLGSVIAGDLMHNPLHLATAIGGTALTGWGIPKAVSAVNSMINKNTAQATQAKAQADLAATQAAQARSAMASGRADAEAMNQARAARTPPVTAPAAGASESDAALQDWLARGSQQRQAAQGSQAFGNMAQQLTQGAAEVPKAPMAPTVGGQAAEHANIMGKIAELYKTYGPAVADHLTAAGKAIAESGAGRALGTAAKVAGPLGDLMMAYEAFKPPVALNEGEEAELAKKHALQNQMMAQKWGNSPTPNAVNSGFTGQLNNLQRRNP